MKKYLTPELLNEELFDIDVMAASGDEPSSSSPSSMSEVDNAIQRFSTFRN